MSDRTSSNETVEKLLGEKIFVKIPTGHSKIGPKVAKAAL
jgi:hypothetical protein